MKHTVADVDVPTAAIAGHPTGYVVDALARMQKTGWIQGILPRSKHVRMTGKARTVRFAPANEIANPIPTSMYAIMRSLQAGEVLVIATGSAECWFLGENMVHEALYAGLGGIVTDGYVRDSAELAELTIPVFSAGISVVPPLGRFVLAELDGPVQIGGAMVKPSDIVHADADGVVTIEREALEDVQRLVTELSKLEKEQEHAIRARLPLPQLHEILARKKGDA